MNPNAVLARLCYGPRALNKMGSLCLEEGRGGGSGSGDSLVVRLVRGAWWLADSVCAVLCCGLRVLWLLLVIFVHVACCVAVVPFRMPLLGFAAAARFRVGLVALLSVVGALPGVASFL